MQIKDSVVMITGGAIRVGRHQAAYLARKGAHISFSYLPGEPWEDAKAEMESFGVRVMATSLDVRNTSLAQQWVADTVQEFGRVDVLINSASVWFSKPIFEITEEDYDNSLDINMKAPFFLAQAAARYMKQQGQGVIINITDCSAFQVWPGFTTHAASKAGLVALTKSLAWELGPEVRVNAIAPGTVLLPPNCSPEIAEWSKQTSVLKKIGQPEDVARMDEFLIESDYTSGAVYFMDGGMSLVSG